MSYPESLRRYWAARERGTALDENFFQSFQREIMADVNANRTRPRVNSSSRLFPLTAQGMPRSPVGGDADGAYYMGSRALVRGITPQEATFEIYDLRNGRQLKLDVDVNLARMFYGAHETMHHLSAQKISDVFSQLTRDLKKERGADANRVPIGPETGERRTPLGAIPNNLLSRMTMTNIEVGLTGLVMENAADIAAEIWLRSNFRRGQNLDPQMARFLEQHRDWRRSGSSTHYTSFLTGVAAQMDAQGRIPFGLSFDKANTMAMDIIKQNMGRLTLDYLAGRPENEVTRYPQNHTDMQIATARFMQQTQLYDTQFRQSGSDAINAIHKDADVTFLAQGLVAQAQKLGIPITDVSGLRARMSSDSNGNVRYEVRGNSFEISLSQDSKGNVSALGHPLPFDVKNYFKIEPDQAKKLMESIPKEIREAAIHPAVKSSLTAPEATSVDPSGDKKREQRPASPTPLR